MRRQAAGGLRASPRPQGPVLPEPRCGPELWVLRASPRHRGPFRLPPPPKPEVTLRGARRRRAGSPAPRPGTLPAGGGCATSRGAAPARSCLCVTAAAGLRLPWARGARLRAGAWFGTQRGSERTLPSDAPGRGGMAKISLCSLGLGLGFFCFGYFVVLLVGFVVVGCGFFCCCWFWLVGRFVLEFCSVFFPSQVRICCAPWCKMYFKFSVLPKIYPIRLHIISLELEK